MRLYKTIKKPTTQTESIFDAEKRQREEAKFIAKTFIHTKPTKYLLK